MSIVTEPERLCFHLQQTPEEVFEPDAVPEAPLVRFVAYAGRQRVYGWVRLREDRLTDLLNSHDELCLTDAEVEDLVDGRVRPVHELLIRVSDLVAVHASGPRGAEVLRRRTRSHPVALQCGKYLVGGHLHAVPGVDPIDDFRRRPAMVPLTDAWIEYWPEGRRTKQAIGTIIVNRHQAEWIRCVSDEDLLEGLMHPEGLAPSAE
jgi:hypothetical protein